MIGTEIYKRTETYEHDAHAIRLHAPQWKLLLAYDGQRTLSEVALSADVPFAEALPLTERFLDRGWIQEQPITLDQYLERAGTHGISSIGTAVPPAVILHEPRPEATPPPFVAEKTAEPASPQNVAPAIPPPQGAMRLSAVIDAVIAAVGNSSIGQLLVYRLFLRVPPELLLAEYISTVHLVNETSLIQGKSLQQAIANAFNEIVKRPLPDSVFAAA